MEKNSLELHLHTLCGENQEYTNLLSTWNLNKKTCVDALKTVVASYPHFSMHDVTHAEAVVTKIEMLLGDRVNKLSPTDTWLILHAAYAHDLGMVLKWEDIEKVWKEDRFSQFLDTTKDSADTQLSKAACAICSARDGNTENPKVIDPLQMSKYVTLLNAAYFRKYHSEISRKYIDLWEDGLKIDLGHSGLIQPRLIKLLGRICELHTSDADEVLNLDYQTDGFGADYAHPRLIAMLLRLGDLLDADNGRFSATATLSIGSLPDSSVPHKNKHESTVHLLVTPTDIEFRSDCPDQESYLETRNFISWLESEIEFLKKYWDIIAPFDLGGYVPRFDKKDVLINGVPDIEGVTGLKFKISQEKAFQIIEGSNIYADPFICFREILQNAIDASKIQMWKDLVAGNYVAWMKDVPITTQLQPFEIDSSIYKNYPIQIALSTLPDGKTQAVITDRGTGISVDNFKRMCNVGVSTTAGENGQVVLSEMPAWLRPTAGFGIGLQSIFLLTDKFEIITSTGTETYKAIVHSNRAGGYLRLQKLQENYPRGTIIRIVFSMPNRYTYAMFGETMRYLYGEYDPFINKNFVGEIRTIESLQKNCTDSIFPLHITASMDQYSAVEIGESVIADDTKNWQCVSNGYYYQLQDDCSEINIWDTKNHTLGRISLTLHRRGNTAICFKGIQVSKNTPRSVNDLLDVELDVYGLETRESLTIDRSRLTSDGHNNIRKILYAFVDLYIEKVIEQLNKSEEKLHSICTHHNFSPYRFWRVCTPKQRKTLPIKYLEYISEEADVLIKNEDGKFEIQTKPAKDIIRILVNNAVFANVSKFEDTAGKRSDKYDNICSILNDFPPEGITEVVVDHILLSTIEGYSWKQIVQPELNGDLFLFTISDGETLSAAVSDPLRKALIKSLGEVLEGAEYGDYSMSDGRRFAIPALKGYECISVHALPFGVARPTLKANWIISPFTSRYRHEVSKMTRDEFTRHIMELEPFGVLVEYVQQSAVDQALATEHNIRDAYKRLLEEYYDVLTGPTE